MTLSRRTNIIYFLFFISGIAALEYQIFWQRILTFFTGSDTTSVSLIVGAYMAGLGIGSLAGGFISDKINNKKRLLYFALAELFIGIFALSSKILFYDYLYHTIATSDLGAWLVFLILFVVLLVPTFLMGASLPLLSKFYVSTTEEAVGLIGKLYFVNTLGASVGALLSIVMAHLVGFEMAIYLAAGFNFLCFFIALLLSRQKSPFVFAEPSPISIAPDASSYSTNFIFWIIVFCFTGFIAVSLEIIWFRMLSIIVKPIFFTFPVLLAVYIGGLAIGSRLSPWIPSSYPKKARLFFYSQLIIVFYVMGTVLLFIKGLEYFPWMESLKHYLMGYDITGSFLHLVMLYGFLVPYFIFIPTVIMGFSFVLMQSILHGHVASVGRNTGIAQFMNILGSSLGAVATSWIFIRYFGTSNSILGLIIIVVVTSVIILYSNRAHWNLSFGKVEIALSLCLFPLIIFPSTSDFWSGLHGKEANSILVQEDETGVASIKLGNNNMGDVVFCNGIGQSILNFEAEDLHVAFGLIPAMLHPHPAEIAIIGLGSGSTLYGFGGNPYTTSITCFEIIKPQMKVLKQYDAKFHNNGLKSILKDKRIHFEYKDARYALKNSKKKFDIIEADALRIYSAYSGNLYSKEYFELLKSRLNPGGFVVTWAPTKRIERTVANVFKYSVLYPPILIASDSPIPDFKQHKVYLNAFAKEYYGQTGIELEPLIKKWAEVRAPVYHVPSKNSTINTDLFPRDEFSRSEKY